MPTFTGVQPSRNQPCPCGSGRKFKKCCLGRLERAFHPNSEMFRRMDEHVRKHLAAEEERKRKFGEVRPIISADFQDHKFVAVGSTLYSSKKWRTFPGFLFDYIMGVMGGDWGKKELEKPLAERHTILRWYNHLCEQQEGLMRDEDGLISIVLDGISSAYLLLAYDLYVLRHHGKLQEEVVRRLRHQDQFQGARYELFVAATFVRAGFDMDYEDETDSTKKHPEFVATHRPSSFVASVEAKMRHRDLAQVAAAGAGAVRAGVRRLLRNAAAKQTLHPLIVFVELNLPPENASQPPSWVPDVQGDVRDVVVEHGGRSPFGLVMFTNRPHQYGLPGDPDPSRHVYGLWPVASQVPEETVNVLGEASQQYGNVPNEFPSDFGSA